MRLARAGDNLKRVCADGNCMLDREDHVTERDRIVGDRPVYLRRFRYLRHGQGADHPAQVVTYTAWRVEDTDDGIVTWNQSERRDDGEL